MYSQKNLNLHVSFLLGAVSLPYVQHGLSHVSLFQLELEIELLEYADSFVLFKHLDFWMWDDKLVISSNEEVIVIHGFTF